MRAINKVLASAAVIASVVGVAAPSMVLAYNPWEAQSDQQTVGQLSAEGVLSPIQAQYLDNKAASKAYGGWNNNAGGMFSGNPYMHSPMAFQNPAQVQMESAQISQLERDGVMSKFQGYTLKSELNEAQIYGRRTNCNAGAYGNVYPSAVSAMPYPGTAAIGYPAATAVAYPTMINASAYPSAMSTSAYPTAMSFPATMNPAAMSFPATMSPASMSFPATMNPAAMSFPGAMNPAAIAPSPFGLPVGYANQGGNPLWSTLQNFIH